MEDFFHQQFFHFRWVLLISSTMHWSVAGLCYRRFGEAVAIQEIQEIKRALINGINWQMTRTVDKLNRWKYIITLLKINVWNATWRFGRWFSFSSRWFSVTAVDFPGWMRRINVHSELVVVGRMAEAWIVSSYLTSFNVVWTFSSLPCLNFFLNHPNVNTAGWKITMFYRRYIYIFIYGWFSIVILVCSGV